MEIDILFDNYCDDADIAESFGIGASFVTNIQASIPEDYQVMLITGESGSGKSVIAREIGITNPIDFDTNTPISECLPMTKEESLRWLASFGLGDAKLFMLPYSKLSDSQMARFRALAATINAEEGHPVVIDEFLSTLDRSTAKFVAYSIRKAIVRSGRRLIAVTAMDDIEPWLMPDKVIRGTAFPSEFRTEEKTWSVSPLDSIRFEYLDANAYRECSLGDLHYRGKYTGGGKDYLFAYFQNQPIAVLLATNRIGSQPEARRIARLVVHPKARGCGVGKMMVKKYLETHRDTDVVAAMAKYSSVFEAAGMVRVCDSVQTPPAGLKKVLRSMSFDFDNWHDVEFCKSFMGKSDNRTIMAQFADKCKKLVQPGGAHLSSNEIAEKITESQDTAGRCLYWLRPRTYAKFVNIADRKDV